jgi:hypothetical protein
MSNKNNNASNSVLGLLGVLFVALKLTGVIDWSWWYVTMPFWGGLAILLILLPIIMYFAIRKAKKEQGE